MSSIPTKTNKLSECVYLRSTSPPVYSVDLKRISTAWGKHTFIRVCTSDPHQMHYFLYDKRLKEYAGHVEIDQNSALHMISQLQLVRCVRQDYAINKTIYCQPYLSMLLPLEYAIYLAKYQIRYFQFHNRKQT